MGWKVRVAVYTYPWSTVYDIHASTSLNNTLRKISFEFFFKNIFSFKNLQLLDENAKFLWVNLNLCGSKRVKFFFLFSSLHDFRGQDLPNKKARALYHAQPLRYIAEKVHTYKAAIRMHILILVCSPEIKSRLHLVSE
jgi:hypothetical protein